jgi:integrase/recombinase XerC/integrase/recombinase XerD
MTASHPINEWLSDLKNRGKSEHTQAAYRRALEHFVTWNKNTYGEASFNPAAIIPRDIEDWKAFQQTVEKAAPATTNQRLVAVSSFFSWAVSQGIARSDPSSEITSVRTKQREPKALSEKDLRHLLRAVHAGGDVRDIAMIELFVGTGIRVGELLALTIGDLVLNDRSGKVIIRKGKHGRYREIPLTAPVRRVLKDYLAVHPNSSNAGAHVWMGQRGPIKNRSAVLRTLEKYATAARLPSFGPHVLRHTFSTRYLKANPGDLRGLAALLGHANINTVMIYTEPTLDDLASRINRIENGE